MIYSIVIHKKTAHNGYDQEAFNTVVVRYPNINRKKGDLREIEEVHQVWCTSCSGYPEPNKTWKFWFEPNHVEIEKIINSYREKGGVEVQWN